MPPEPYRPDTRPAEQVLEDLLRAWPRSAETRGKAMPERRPFATAFLPPASHQTPRPPAFRLKTPPMARVDLRPTRKLADIVPKPGTFKVPTPTFQAVADAIAARGAGPAAPGRTTGPDAEDAAEPAQGASECSEDHRFAAWIVALKAAGVLDPPAASGGGSPAPFGYADRYVGGAALAFLRHAEDASGGYPPVPGATVVAYTRPGDPDRPLLLEAELSAPFGSDDDIALPRSIFL